ncbi:AAA-domain-containing protein [Abortiporus biennis]|nr:AAA-domain-containing protein [Abortiporus biennis]
MPRRARIHFVSLRSSLVNLPISLYGPLLERGVRPQGLAVLLTLVNQSNGKANGSNKKEAYVGWTGMASASSLAHFQAGNAEDKGLETVEIDPQFASGLGFTEGDIVEIGLLHDLGYASSVATEPLTADDWEILELHAAHVESTLLSQVRVARIGQEIDVWVLGRTRVRLRVTSLEPSTKGTALLLTTSTEVSIAPKTRTQGKAPIANGAPLKVSSVRGGSNPASENGITNTRKDQPTKQQDQKPTRILRVIPSRVLSTFQPHKLPDEDSQYAAIAYVSETMLRLIRFTKGSKPSEEYKEAKTWIASVHRFIPPQDPTQEQREPATAAPVPRVLVPTDHSSAKPTPPAPPKDDEVLVTWSPDVPVDSDLVILHGSVGGIEDWDMVRFVFLRETDPITDTEKNNTAQPQKQSEPSHGPGLAGVDDIITKCNEFAISTFAVHASSSTILGVPGLLITGRSGAGKTSILNAAAKSLQENPKTFAYTLYVDLSRYTDTPVSKIKSLFRFWYEKAQYHRPTVLVMDNMDKLMSVEQEHTDSFRARHITELFIHHYGSSFRTPQPNSKGIILLGSAESKQALHPTLSQCHAFLESIHLKPPTKEARKEILSKIVKSHLDTSDLIQDPDAPLNITSLAMETEGYSATDLKDLVARAVHQAAIRVADHESEKDYQPTLANSDFVKAQADYVPLSLRDVKLQKSDTSWADIGGLKETRRVLRETLEWPTKYGPIFRQSPLRLRQGLMLYGYPGCGKTLLASAIAKECGLNFISVKGPELLNKYIGASEQSVRELFERASAAKPCVLFFDEFDSIAPKRGHDSTGVTDRVVNQMLTQLDGVEGLDGVYVLAATSRPDLIDSALLRPGRLDKSLLCNMPDEEERKEILEAVSRKVTLSPSVDLNSIARRTEGFSGADLQALLYNAHLEVIHETLAASTNDSDSPQNRNQRSEDVPHIEYKLLFGPSEKADRASSKAEKDALQRRLHRILQNTTKTRRDNDQELPKEAARPHVQPIITEEHIQKVLKTTRPSVPHEERLRLDRIYRAFVNDRSGELPVPPDAGGVGHRVTLA